MTDRKTSDRDDERFALDGAYLRTQTRDALWTFFHPWSFAPRTDDDERERLSRR